MIQNGNDHILKLYHSENPLTKQHSKLIMQDAASLGFETFSFQVGQRNNVLILASAIMFLFPKEYPSINLLIPVRGRNSPLYNAVLNRVRLERQKQKEVGGKKNGDNDKSDSEESENEENSIEEHINYLESAHSKEIESIKKSLIATWSFRQEILGNPERDINALIYNFFIADVNFISFEFNLYIKNKYGVQLINDGFEIVKMDILFKVDPKMQNNMYEVADAIKPFYGLIKLLGHGTSRKKMNHPNIADTFEGACGRLIQFICINAPNSETDKITNTQPYLLGKFETNLLAVKQYCIVYESRIIPLDPKFTFIQCFDMLFKVFHIFDIHYPSSLEKFYLFFEEFIYGFKRNDIPHNSFIFQKIVRAKQSITAITENVDRSENMESSSGTSLEGDEEETSNLEEFSDIENRDE